MSKLDELNDNLKRIGDLIEKALDQSDVEVEIPPPQCPTCRKINPKILVEESQARGPFSEYILLASCLHCGKPFYGVPMVWTTMRSKDQAIMLLQQHLERLGLNGSDSR